MARRRDTNTANMFDAGEPDLAAAIALVTVQPEPLEAPASAAPCQDGEPHGVRAPAHPEDSGERQRRERLDRIFATGNIADAIGMTAVACERAGYPVLSIGIFGESNFIVQAQGTNKPRLDATSDARNPLGALREIIQLARNTTP